jgi:hypothetical protein
MSAFADDWEQVASGLAEAFGDTVTLSRGSSETSGITAQYTDEAFTISDPSGAATVIQARSWLILVTDAVIDGGQVEPTAGYRITDANGYVWEANAIAGRRAVELFEDGLYWLILTKRVL